MSDICPECGCDTVEYDRLIRNEDNMNKFNFDHETPIDGNEVAERLKGILKAAGVKMLITDARVSAIFPDGSVARYQELYLDTEQ